MTPTSWPPRPVPVEELRPVEERKAIWLAAMREAGYGDVEITGGFEAANGVETWIWTSPHSLDLNFRLASYRAFMLSGLSPTAVCWPCFRDYEDCSHVPEWPTDIHQEAK